jgi:PAS domain S-box-containing protein
VKFNSSFGIFTDITDRKDMERELTESEERYKELVEKADIAIVIDDADGNYVYYNHKFSQLYGYSEKDVGKLGVKDLCHPDDQAMVLKYHEARLKRRKAPERYRFKGLKKNGDIVHVEVDAMARIVNGKVGGTRAFLRDITEQVQMEESLKSSEEWYKALVEMAGIAIIQDDTQGNIVYHNKKFLDLYGYTEKEIKTIKRKDLIHPEDYKMVMGHHRTRMAGKKSPTRYRFKGRRKTGETVRIEVDIAPIVRDGKNIGTRAYLKDITKMYDMEQSLKQSEDMFRDLVEKAGIAILIDGKDGEFKYFNQKFLDLFGYNSADMRQLGISDLVHPEDMKKVMKRHKERVGAKEPPNRYRFRGVQKNGETVYLEVDAREMLEEGKIVGTRAYLWDITKRVKVEESIKKHKAMLDGMKTVESGIKTAGKKGKKSNKKASNKGAPAKKKGKK